MLQRLADRFAPVIEDGDAQPEVFYTNDEAQAKEELREKFKQSGYDLEALSHAADDGLGREAETLT